MTDDLKLPSTSLPNFVLTEGEVERALEYPVVDMIRKEIRLKPDVFQKKPKYIKRIIATGIEAWEQRGDSSFNSLVQKLLYLFFIGELHVGAVATQSQGRFAMSDEEIVDDEEDFDDDFGFVQK